MDIVSTVKKLVIWEENGIFACQNEFYRCHDVVITDMGIAPGKGVEEIYV